MDDSQGSKHPAAVVTARPDGSLEVTIYSERHLRSVGYDGPIPVQRVVSDGFFFVEQLRAIGLEDLADDVLISIAAIKRQQLEREGVIGPDCKIQTDPD